MANLRIGSRVEVTGKDSQGFVAFIGTTSFALGKWIGVILDEPKGKNNGTVQGRSYFQCKENHGTFVRMSQLSLIDESGNKIDLASSADESTLKSPALRSRLSSSRQSLPPKITTPSRSREDIAMPMTNPPVPNESLLKRASFVESPSSLNKSTPKSRLSVSTPTLKIMKSRIPMTKSLSGHDKAEPTKNEQTGFVETLKPQFTPGQAKVSPGIQTHRINQVLIDPLEHEGLKAQVQDLTEKLDTIKIKHKEKMHEIDALRLKLDQSAEFKIKIMESQASLKKELEQVKQEKQEAVQAHEDLSDIADALEMATLDKEMAEEKAEALQTELAETRGRIEEMTLDYEILKAEFDKMCTPTEDHENNATNIYQMKQLEQQNVRLRETLVRMRDLSAHEKHELQKLQKELDERKNESTELRKSNEKLQLRIYELETLIGELHEQVDAALGAEEMVEQLGLQKLTQEDRIKELEEVVSDLESLQDINEQLQEDRRETELQLREELDLANAANREILKEKENAFEALADRELTIIKFRELVQKLQDQCQELQLQLQKESISNNSAKMAIPDMFDFKKMFAETRAQARAIDLELRRMEVQQGQQHIQYLIAYMPDSFMTRGGDNDAVLTLILITRLVWKTEILLCQVRDKFPSVELSNKGELVKGHTAEQFASRCRLSYHLHLLQAILRQFSYGLNTCTTETLLRVGGSYPDMSQQERILDSYIELLKTDQLDENVRTETLEKCVTYFNTMHTLLLLSSGDTCIHQAKLLLDHSVAFSTACDSIRTDVAIVQALIQSDDTSDIAPLCQHLATVAEVMQQHLKQIRRKISGSLDAVVLPIPELATNLLKTSICASKLTKALREISKIAFSQIALTTDELYLSPSKLLEISNTSCEKVFDEMPSIGFVACLKSSMNYFANEVANIAQAMLEADTHSPEFSSEKQEKSLPPISVRAAQVKSDLEQTKALQCKIDNRDSDIRELKNLLKTKQEEISELIIRKELTEKKVANSDGKLANTIRDYELQIQKTQRKLDEATELIKRKETEFEETMDHLQADIDSLECEKGELKDKLKSFSKKGLFDSFSKSSSSVTGHVSTGFPSPIAASSYVKESPLLINEIKSLRSALSRERSTRAHLENDYYKKILRKLEPIPLLDEKREIDDDLNNLEKKTKLLIKDIESALSLPKVVDVSKRRPGTNPALEKSAPVYHIITEIHKSNVINGRLQELKNSYMKEALKRKLGGRIETALGVFPSPGTKLTLDQKEPITIGTLSLPCDKKQNKKTVTVQLRMQEVRQLMSKLSELCI